jgi:hypothetical protein
MKHFILALLFGLYTQPVISQHVVQLDSLPDLPGQSLSNSIIRHGMLSVPPYIPVKMGTSGYRLNAKRLATRDLDNNYSASQDFYGGYINVANNNYGDGLIYSDSTGMAFMGDYNEDVNGTAVAVNDNISRVYINANNNINENTGHYRLSNPFYPNGILDIADGNISIGNSTDYNGYYSSYDLGNGFIYNKIDQHVDINRSISQFDRSGAITFYLGQYSSQFKTISTTPDAYGSSYLNIGNLLTGGSYSGEYGGGTPSAGLVIEVNGSPYVVPLLAY